MLTAETLCSRMRSSSECVAVGSPANPGCGRSVLEALFHRSVTSSSSIAAIMLLQGQLGGHCSAAMALAVKGQRLVVDRPGEERSRHRFVPVVAWEDFGDLRFDLTRVDGAFELHAFAPLVG